MTLDCEVNGVQLHLQRFTCLSDTLGHIGFLLHLLEGTLSHQPQGIP